MLVAGGGDPAPPQADKRSGRIPELSEFPRDFDESGLGRCLQGSVSSTCLRSRPSGVSLQLLRLDLSQLERVIITPSTPGSISGEWLVEADSLPGSGASGPLFHP